MLFIILYTDARSNVYVPCGLAWLHFSQTKLVKLSTSTRYSLFLDILNFFDRFFCGVIKHLKYGITDEKHLDFPQFH